MFEKATLEQDQLYVFPMNSGSSSIKFALYQMRDPPKRGLHGKWSASAYPEPPSLSMTPHGINRTIGSSKTPIIEAKRVERYGFHGLSYASLMEELARAGGADAAQGRVILAPLENGASLAAVRGGAGIDTSMGFTPTAALTMSTRSGDLDRGLVRYLAQTEHMTVNQFYQMVNHESGLLGVSETSSDLPDLLGREAKRCSDCRSGCSVLLSDQEVDRRLCHRGRRPGHAGLRRWHRGENAP